MRHSVREDRSTSGWQDDSQEYSVPVSTIENPLMEELHTVSSSSAPAWKTTSTDDEQNSAFANESMFISIDDELSDTNGRPIAPTNATILSEKEVKEHFSYSDEQLEYRKGMKFSERMTVTFRKVAVFFSDLWDRYIDFMKQHFPSLLEERGIKTFTYVGLGIIFAGLALIAILALIL